MIPSLLQIPSAVSDSKLHSVLPNNGKGDFTFDRSTGATRINKDGLIEELGYFSSELVQNGDFSELGSEIIPDPNFDTDSTSYWAIATTGGTPRATKSYIDTFEGKFMRLTYDLANGAALNRGGAIVSGKSYRVTFKAKGTANSAFASVGNNGDLGTVVSNPTLTTSFQDYEFYITATQTTFRLYLSTSGVDIGDTLDIDNISLKQVDPNDRWTVSGVDIALDTNGIKLTTNDSSNGGIYQAVTTVVGNDYRLKLDFVAGNVNGIVQVGTSVFGGELYQNTSVTSNLIINFTATATTTYINLRVAASGATDKHCFYNNISIVEVQGDRPRLSYDITNGVVEDKPHLLLEPSSTNLFPFSEDYTQSNWNKSNVTITQNAGISPENLNNASKMIVSSNASFAYIHDSLSGSSSKYSISAFVKADGRNIVWLYINSTSTNGTIYYDLSDGTLQAVAGGSGTPTGTITAFPNDWYKITYTSPTAFVLNSGSGIGLSDAKGSTAVTVDGTNGVLIYGLQIEAQSYATSYIPTAGTTITRAAETCNNSKPSVNSTEGVLYAEIASLANDGTFRQLTISDSSTSDRVSIDFTSTNNQIRSFCSSGSSTVANMTGSVTDATQFNKVAVKYKLNDYALYVNGSEVATDTSGATPVGLQEIAFNNGGGSNIFYGKVKGLAVYNEALTDAQLIQLTS